MLRPPTQHPYVHFPQMRHSPLPQRPSNPHPPCIRHHSRLRLGNILRRPPPLLHIPQPRRRRRPNCTALLPGNHLELIVRRWRLPQLVEALLRVKSAPGTPPAVPRDEDEGAVPRHPPAAAPDGAVAGGGHQEAAAAAADVEEEACRADDEEGEEWDDDVG
ncbi:hypothetical protein CCMA1212_001028 [Trichoderma ghanense]|uniref:Uncharacterized protein n=1 Tax=Trichoderma ghanense TaxID=65468 RepID=A0ABY2HET4_9HYPO